MPKIEKITSRLFPEVFQSFLHDDDPLSDEQDWRNVFDYQYPNAQDYCGYALLDEGKVIGILGMVFSERMIAGEKHHFCNLHTWWIKDMSNRGRSLALMRPVQRMKDHTLTYFTPCDIIRAVTKRIGFSELNSQMRILLPTAGSRDGDSNLTFVESEIRDELGEFDVRILDDHLPYRLGHLLIRDGKSHCYVVYAKVIRHRMNYAHVHYVSNRDLFVKHQYAARSAIMRRERVRLIAVDCRLFEGARLPFGFNFWAPAHALYRSHSLQPSQIDNLYSDVAFLRLTMLPDISHELTQIAKRWLPGGGASVDAVETGQTSV